MTPSTWPARAVAGMLCFISVLFMAMPISVSGQAFRVAAVTVCWPFLFRQTCERNMNGCVSPYSLSAEVVGNAMSQTWADRNRILLVTRARQRLKNWGVSASCLAEDGKGKGHHPVGGSGGVVCCVQYMLLVPVLGRAMIKSGYQAQPAFPACAVQVLEVSLPSQGDMPRLFRKFDQDGNGELGMDEFCDACRQRARRLPS